MNSNEIKSTAEREPMTVSLWHSSGDWVAGQSLRGDGCSSDGRYRFLINQDPGDADFVVVMGKPFKEARTFNVDPARLVLSFYEPYPVYCYPAAYRKQFGTVLACQKEVRDLNAVHIQPVLPWTVGVNFIGSKRECSMTNADLRATATPDKTKLMSVITSDKAFTKGHYGRIRFVEKLKEHFGDRVDVFGQGIRDFDDKWSVLAPYKYHVVIENTRTRYYWTEKLIDSFLAEAFPIYYGCTNIKDYFPGIDIPEIDIFDASGAIKVIEKTIADGAYEKNRQALAEAKALTLLHYNIFDTIARELDKILERNPEARPEKVTVKPPVSMGNLHNAVNYTLTHNWYKWLNRKGTTLSKK